MIDTDRQPHDCYIGEGIDPDGLEALARRSMSVTGIPQRIHNHGAGESCRGHGCGLLEP